MMIKKLTRVTKSAVKDINNVIRQLHEDSRKGTISDVRAIVNDKNHALVVVQDGKKIVGVATLYVLQKIGKRTGYVEDVVVDSGYRGQGLGEKLMRKVISTAKSKKVKTLYLTSRSLHVAAHHLYRKVGFKVKETNVFKLDL